MSGYTNFENPNYDIHSIKEYFECDDSSKDVEKLNEFICERVGEALEDCEFIETPELKEAIKGFYADHYYLASVIGYVIDSEYNNPVLKHLLQGIDIYDWEKEIAEKFPVSRAEREKQSPNAKVAAYRIGLMASKLSEMQSVLTEQEVAEQRFNLLRQCGVALMDNLFRETSVGITTISSQEVNLAIELAERIKHEVGKNKIWQVPALSVDFPDGATVEFAIRSDINKFWEDTRHAGQLEFHGSGDLGGINQNGIMSRNQQVRVKGGMRAQQAVNFSGVTMHSVVPHFSEFYALGEYSNGENGGTVAVPLLKIIEQAPFARDAKYGLLQPKSLDTITKTPTPTLNLPTARIGAGVFDSEGETGVDRVYFSSPDERTDKLPDDYQIDVHSKDDMPATFIIDRTLHIHNPDRELHQLGYGYGFPERLVIDVSDNPDDPIRTLQEKYLKAFSQNGIVVSLRRGVFAQMFENSSPISARGRSAAKIYNIYYVGSERN